MVKLGSLAIALAFAAGGWLAYSVLWPDVVVEDRDLQPGVSREFGRESLHASQVSPGVRHDAQPAMPYATAASAGPAPGRETADEDRFVDPEAPPASSFNEPVSDAGEFLRPEDHPAPGRLEGGVSDVGQYLDPDESIGEYQEADESIWGAFAKDGEG